MNVLAEVPLLRQSERGAFKRCNWAWYQQYVLNRVPIFEKKDAADFGTLIHVALAEYYIPGQKRGPHPAGTFKTLAEGHLREIRTVESNNEEQIVKWEDFNKLGVELMEGYVEFYQGDRHWDVLDAERRFDVVVPDTRYPRIESQKGRKAYRPVVVIVGTFDLCIRDLNDNTIKMVDHKTAAQIYTQHLTLDEQASTYITVADTALRHQGLIGPMEKVIGMEYNFIRKAKLYKEPLKADLVNALKGHFALHPDDEYSWNWEKDLKDELKTYCNDLDVEVHGEPVDKPIFVRQFVPRTPKEKQRQIVRISEEARVMDMVRKGTLPVLKTPAKDCAFCKYYDLCELDESGGDVDYFVETTMKQADPYFDHRPEAINSKKITDA